MKHRLFWVAFPVVGFTALCMLAAPAARGIKEISLAELRNKIEGGWAGQMIGVSYGAPTEFRYMEKIYEGALPPWTPERVRNSLGQDDLYVDMTFAKVLDDKGLDATSDDFGALFKNTRYSLWHANNAGRRNLRRGIPASSSGAPEYNAHANDIDFQIESDFIGLMSPGLPRAANDIALRAGRVTNYGDGLYGGMFVGCMYSTAFFEKDARKVVEGGLACIPAESPYAMLISKVLGWSRQYPNDWKKVWALIGEEANKREACPEGALRPFNIDAKLNGSYVVLGLLYGNGDLGKTIEIATRSGQDSDCNPATAGGILGVMLGYKAIPDEWKGGIPAISNQKFRTTDFTFPEIVASTEKRAIALVERNGGKVDGDRLLVKVQQPQATKAKGWDDYDSPVERIDVESPRWTWKSAWRRDCPSCEVRKLRGPTVPSRIAAEKGAEASIDFEGTGAIVVGPYLDTGGRADVYLDGRLDRTVDVYSDGARATADEAVWHKFGLRIRNTLCASSFAVRRSATPKEAISASTV